MYIGGRDSERLCGIGATHVRERVRSKNIEREEMKSEGGRGEVVSKPEKGSMRSQF